MLRSPPFCVYRSAYCVPTGKPDVSYRIHLFVTEVFETWMEKAVYYQLHSSPQSVEGAHAAAAVPDTAGV